MKKFALCLLLTLCLVGCAPAAPASPSASVPSPSGSSAPEGPIYSLPQAADVPPGNYTPWQEAYAGFLVNLRTSEYQFDLGELARPDDSLPSDSYSLYDIDKNGIPELFLQCGTCEADYYTLVYTFLDGQMTDLGSFQSGHSSLYSCPGENAVLVHCAHMGYGEIDKFSLTDSAIGPWETLLTEGSAETSDDYTYPGDLIPGAQRIPCHYINTQFRPADAPALVLPVYDYQGRELPAPMDEAEVRAVIGRVLYENAPLFGVSGEGYAGDTGLTVLEDYLRPGGAYPYGDQPLEVKKIAWADVNGDGQIDCLLWLEQPREKWTDELCAILSAEDDGVYAYFFEFVEDIAVDRKGTVRFQGSADHWKQVSFYQNQCCTFPVPALPGADRLAWDTFE